MFKVNNTDTRTVRSSVYIVNFEHVIAGWVVAHFEYNVQNRFFRSYIIVIKLVGLNMWI